MTEFEKEQILKLVETMLDYGQEYMIWTLLNPDWDKINTREALSKTTYAVSIKKYEDKNEALKTLELE